MIVLFLIAASAAASAPARTASPSPPPATSPARSVIEAQLRSPPRADSRPSLSAEEADAIYKRYLASIGQRPESRSGNAP